MAPLVYANVQKDKDVVWYRDKATGKNMERPGWERLMRNLQPGDTIVCWRLDRLGRTAS